MHIIVQWSFFILIDNQFYVEMLTCALKKSSTIDQIRVTHGTNYDVVFERTVHN